MSPWKTTNFWIALGIPLLATGIQFAFWGMIQPFIYFLYYPAVFLSSWVGQWQAGLLATLLSAGLIRLCFIPLVETQTSGHATTTVSLGLFMGMGFLFSFLHAKLRSTERHLESMNSKLADVKHVLEKRIQVRTDDLRSALTGMERNEKLYRLLAENVSDVIWILDMETRRFRYVSPSVERMRGYTPAEVLAGGLSDAVTPFSQAFLEKVIPERIAVFERGERAVYRDEIEQYCRDGRIVKTETLTRYVRNPENGHLEVYGTSRDITDRKRTEDMLRHHEQILRETGRIAKVGGWEFDPATGQGTWTEEVAHIHGLDPADPTNTQVGLSFYEEPHRTRIMQAVQEAGKGVPFDLELELVTRQGLRKWVRTIGDPVVENGGVARVRGAFLDITEQKRTEQTIRDLAATLELKVAERTAALEASNRELESFSYSVSHDLRAPLRAIEGFTRILQEEHGATLSPEAQALLQRVIKASKRMSALIDDLLVLARLSRAELEREKINLSEIAGSVVSELRQGTPTREVDVEIEPELFVDGDVRLLRTVLENLLGNAWKFSARKEKARIAMKRVPSGEGETVICIEDNGAGFDMEYVGKLFGVFQRLHSESEFPGVGVGLASVQRVIRRHGGRVWAESSPGQGARFYFSLPVLCGTPNVQPSP